MVDLVTNAGLFECKAKCANRLKSMLVRYLRSPMI
jgi:hypothetical protein